MITKSQITDIKSLKDKAQRAKFSLFVVEGEKMFQEIEKSNFFVKKIFFIPAKVSVETKKLINSSKAELLEVSEKEMERISQLKTCTPILTTVALPNHKFNYCDGELILALDNVQDPGNLGTIIRIADWFGIKDIICSPDSADLFNSKVVQATMGAITRVRVHYMPLAPALSDLAKRGVSLYGTFLDGETIYNENLSDKGGVIIMGNEGRGVSAEIAALVNKKLFIPPFPADAATSESLNVAVATAIVCNEFRRK